MQIVFFEGKTSQQLQPITLTRSACTIRCAGTTLRKLITSQIKFSGQHFIVPTHLNKVLQQLWARPKKIEDKLLFVDSTIVPDIKFVSKLSKLIKADKSFVIKQGREVLVAHISCREVGIKNIEILKLTPETIQSFLTKVKVKNVKQKVVRFENIWEVITKNIELLNDNLKIISQGMRKVATNVSVGKNVKLAKTVVLDTSNGMIVIDDRTKVADHVVLRGPLFIGRECQINSFAEIKDNTTIGDVCKIGGEIEESVFQAYTNKQHYGYIGNSYIGKWVNLGSGTTNSDLKSTYGEIKMLGKRTGQQFLGCVIADDCKTSIGTMIYTGKVIGVNSMVYGAVTVDIPSFTNGGSLVEKHVEVPVDIAIKVQKAVMARRKIKISAAYIKMLWSVYGITEDERKAAKVGKGKLVLM